MGCISVDTSSACLIWMWIFFIWFIKLIELLAAHSIKVRVEQFGIDVSRSFVIVSSLREKNIWLINDFHEVFVTFYIIFLMKWQILNFFYASFRKTNAEQSLEKSDHKFEEIYRCFDWNWNYLWCECEQTKRAHFMLLCSIVFIFIWFVSQTTLAFKSKNHLSFFVQFELSFISFWMAKYFQSFFDTHYGGSAICDRAHLKYAKHIQ